MSVRLAGVDHLSPSGAAKLIDCERAYWWRYARGLGRDERTEALAMGGGLATALELGNLDEGLAEYYRRRPLADDFTDPVKRIREGWIADATIRHAFAGYTLRYPDPPNLIREETYLCTLPGVDRLLQVRVDGVVPGEYLVEDKLRSASSMRAEAIENERLQGDQLTAEIYGHWRATKGEELLPIRFRNTKKIDPRKVKNLETQAEVEEAMAAHFAGEVFFEWEVTRTEAQLEQFEQEFADLARRSTEILDGGKLVFTREQVDPGPFGRRNTKSCHMYGRTCPALAHCQGHVTVDELLELHAALRGG